MDESAITGECKEVEKVDLKAGKTNCDSFLLSGSKVMEGTAYMFVLAVGKNSLEGISKMKLQQDSDTTPLQEKLEVLANHIGSMGILSAGLTFLALFLHRVVHIIRFLVRVPVLSVQMLLAPPIV
jgi:magnesium-transporting ATPase (P-type)